MATDHFQPGEPAPIAGMYVLFDRDGAPTGCGVRREAGEPLPLITINGRGPLHYRCIGYNASEEAA